MRYLTKKRLLVLAVVAAGAAIGTTAFAYFTTTGSGSGSASVGSSSALTLHGTTVDALYPGAATEVDFTVDNPSPGQQWVGTVKLDSVTTDGAHSSCNMSDFTMPDVTVGQNFAHGNGLSVTATGTLTMADNGNQDACKGAPLTLHLSST
jgi:hypothetical protein